MVRKFLDIIGRSLQLVIVPEWRAVRLDQERHLRRLLPYLKVDCVFDVGANVGQYAQMLRNYVGYRGRIVSFEPNPTAFRRLDAAASRDRLWHVEPFALGNNIGTDEFHAYEHSELGSFRTFGQSAHAPRGMAAKSIAVTMRTLEAYLPEAKARWDFRHPFLKLDTQGFDLEVAKGAGLLLNEFVGLQSEIAFQTIYDGAPTYLSALEFYQSAGFVISRLVPIHESYFPDLVEMDIIMVRADLVNPDSAER